MRRLFWPLVWVVAVVALSRCFHVGHLWAAERSAAVALAGLGWGALLAGSMFLLMLRTYAAERARGKVVRQIRLFERILESGAHDND